MKSKKPFKKIKDKEAKKLKGGIISPKPQTDCFPLPERKPDTKIIVKK